MRNVSARDAPPNASEIGAASPGLVVGDSRAELRSSVAGFKV